ncbi:MAG TPA: VOC family protein [Acidimicrobiales bacterium]|jgi:predicted enzyme related to lactoylglutathione lyase/uncharacterized protein YndB with AHSA1/START domain
MTTTETVVVQIDVGVDPDTAFKVFTEDIGSWYKDTLYSWNDPGRAVGIRIEPGVGGRWIEVWDADTGEGWELGRITAWEPGRRLVLDYHSMKRPEPRTEIEVTFDPIAKGTRVTLEHRGWEQFPPEVASEAIAGSRIGEPYLLTWFAEHVGGSLAAGLGYLSFGVSDPDQAATFFGALFGWEFAPASDEAGHVYRHIEGVAPAMGVNNDRGPCPVHGVRPRWRLWFRVDDLDAAMERVRELGGTVGTHESGRSGGYAECRDDQGVDFELWTPASAYVDSPLAGPAQPGQLGYFTLSFPDAGRAHSFYGQLLGWFVEPGLAAAGQFHVSNTALPMGLTTTSGDDAPAPTLYFRVDDIAATAARVRELGGTTADIGTSDSGAHAACFDDQGTPLSLWQPAPGY